LIAAILVFGAGLGWLVNRVRLHRDAVESLQDGGGLVIYDWDVSDLSGQLVPGRRPAWQTWVAERIGIDFLGRVCYQQLAGRGTEPLDRLRDLGGRVEGLSLDEVSQAALSDLGRLTSLRHLNLDETHIDDAGLAHLESLTRLEVLLLRHTQITDAGLAHLSGLKQLKALALSGTRITDAGLAHLEGLTHLQYLDLEDTRIGDAGLERLKGLAELQRLDLTRTPVTDAGLQHLRRLGNLRALAVRGTTVGNAGLAKLKCDLRESAGPP
jgi:Leucine-rich repeat (LRR) protein